MWGQNASVLAGVLLRPPPCQGWANGTEDGLYQLGSMLLALGYMGGSGTFGGLYLFGWLLGGFVCRALWGALSACGLDALAWGGALAGLCALRLALLVRRIRPDAPPPGEVGALYRAVFQPLGASPAEFRPVAEACGNRVWTLREGDVYALERATPIDQLSFLLSGRVRVSQEGQFVQYIFPFQFLDSPEWESLRPTDEGTFQVTLRAETDCRYVAWRRHELAALLARDRYVSRLFAVLLGGDIADKLYALNQRVYVKRGLLLDIRLPGLYFALEGRDPAPAPDPLPPGHRRHRGDSHPEGGAPQSSTGGLSGSGRIPGVIQH